VAALSKGANVRLVIIVAALSGLVTTQATELDRLRWLGGCWEMQRGQRITTEMWMPPAGGLMMGASRTVNGGQVRATEQIQLEVQNGRLVYIALPSGQAETRFESTEVTDSGFVVENPAHDFPQKISYRRRGADSLIARIEGPMQGQTRGIDYPMRRVSCGG
jgi:hypothetical protein